jgi:hypothetical protein
MFEILVIPVGNRSLISDSDYWAQYSFAPCGPNLRPKAMVSTLKRSVWLLLSYTEAITTSILDAVKSKNGNAEEWERSAWLSVKKRISYSM